MIASGFETDASRVFDRLELAGLVDVAVLSPNVAQVVAGLHFERSVGRLESVSVRSVVVDPVDLFQDGHRSRLGVGVGHQQHSSNQQLWE